MSVKARTACVQTLAVFMEKILVVHYLLIRGGNPRGTLFFRNILVDY